MACWNAFNSDKQVSLRKMQNIFHDFKIDFVIFEFIL